MTWKLVGVTPSANEMEDPELIGMNLSKNLIAFTAFLFHKIRLENWRVRESFLILCGRHITSWLVCQYIPLLSHSQSNWASNKLKLKFRPTSSNNIRSQRYQTLELNFFNLTAVSYNSCSMFSSLSRTNNYQTKT